SSDVCSSDLEEPAALEHLEIPELADQDEERDGHHRCDHHDALLPGIAPAGQGSAREAHDGSPSKRARRACTPARLSTTAAPTNPLKSACGITTYIIN